MTRRALKTAEVTKVDQLCEVGRRSTNSPAQGRARHDRRTRREPTQERRRRSVTRGGGEAAPLQHIRAVTPRTAAVPCSRGRRNRRLVDCRNHGRELSITFPRWPSGLFPRRTKAGSSNTAYPRCGPPDVNSPGFPRGVLGFSMIRTRWRFLSVTRRLNLARRARMNPEGTPVTRILIADDHEVVRFGLRAILEAHEGWEVVAEACDGKEAIAKAVETSPDVAIIDYSLPMMNGVEATRQIRARVPTAEVLIFTMHDSE